MRRCAWILALALWFSAAHAQQQDGKPVDNPPVETVEPVSPYDDKLLRLAEILGAVHYLRTLCGANEGNKWRDVMSKMLVSEEPGPKRKARLIASFNRGYRTFRETYGSCTNSALLASERYMSEGSKLAGQITTRYGR